jgi:hypothetical protein
MANNASSYLMVNNEGTSYNTIHPPDKAKTYYPIKMNYDDILEELGELGPWHILHLALLWLPAMASGVFVLTYSFTGRPFKQVTLLSMILSVL